MNPYQVTCTSCKQSKESSEFFPRDKRCKSCNNERVKEYYSRPEIKAKQRELARIRRSNPEKREILNARSRAYAREKSPEKRMWECAKKRGLTFDIEVSDIVIPDACPLLGIPLSHGVGHSHAASPSLDRIDPSKGYVKGNVWVISSRANAIKNDATPDELERIAKAVRARLNQI